MTEISIRSAVAADAAMIADIYDHHARYGTASFDSAGPGEGEMSAKISKAAEKGWPFLVAEQEGEIRGYAYATQFRDRPAYVFACENSVYVHPDHMGQGIGRTLLAALIDAAERAGFRQMIAVIGGGEPASIVIHRSAGFSDAGRMRSVGHKFGRWLDTVYMQRALGPGDAKPPEAA